MSVKWAVEVRAKLFERKMTQKELAEIMSISTPYLSDILRGKKDGPRAQERIEQIKNILNIK